MGRIVIEVADETTKKWRKLSPEKKREIAQKLDIILVKELKE